MNGIEAGDGGVLGRGDRLVGNSDRFGDRVSGGDGFGDCGVQGLGQVLGFGGDVWLGDGIGDLLRLGDVLESSRCVGRGLIVRGGGGLILDNSGGLGVGIGNGVLLNHGVVIRDGLVLDHDAFFSCRAGVGVGLVLDHSCGVGHSVGDGFVFVDGSRLDLSIRFGLGLVISLCLVVRFVLCHCHCLGFGLVLGLVLGGWLVTGLVVRCVRRLVWVLGWRFALVLLRSAHELLVSHFVLVAMVLVIDVQQEHEPRAAVVLPSTVEVEAFLRFRLDVVFLDLVRSTLCICDAVTIGLGDG